MRSRRVLNDRVLTFLNRARRVELGPISLPAVRAYFAHAFRVLEIKCPDEMLDRATSATRGLPYLMQLVGYYLVQYAQDSKSVDDAVAEQAEMAALADMDANVFEPILAPLSDNDRSFLAAMAVDDGVTTTAALQARLGDKGPAIQPYRRRLIDAGVIESPRKGELVFAVPYLAEYPRKRDA